MKGVVLFILLILNALLFSCSKTAPKETVNKGIAMEQDSYPQVEKDVEEFYKEMSGFGDKINCAKT